MNTTMKGNISEGAVAAALLKAGMSVFLPIGNQADYDLIADNSTRLIRIQCRTGRLRSGGVVFNTKSVEKIWRGQKVVNKAASDSIDAFGVYCPDNDAVYLVPNEGLPKASMSLRVKPSKNNQTKGISWASDYNLCGPGAKIAHLVANEEVAGSTPVGRSMTA